MYKHILVPVDGSETAAKAVGTAAGLARAFGSQITVIYVIDPYPFTGVGAEFGFGQDQYLVAAKAEGDSALAAAQTLLQSEGVQQQVHTQVVEGHVVHKTILSTAGQVGADLIVMGSHGRRGLEKLVLGSVTQRVLSHAHMQVLVVRD